MRSSIMLLVALAALFVLGSEAATSCLSAGLFIFQCIRPPAPGTTLPITSIWFLRAGSPCLCPSNPLPNSALSSILSTSYAAYTAKSYVPKLNCTGSLACAPLSDQPGKDICTYQGPLPATTYAPNPTYIDWQRCDMTAAILGDPHLVGFDGTRFEFNGYGGGVFNLISESRHQLNVNLDSFGVADSTFIRAVGFKYGSDLRFAVETGASFDNETSPGGLFVALNGEPLVVSGNGAASEAQLMPADDVMVKVINTADGKAEIEVNTPGLSFSVLRLPGNKHLDISVKLLESMDMHGVLGQTVRWTGNDNQFEGDETDYAVTSLLADDFSFNKFQKPNKRDGRRGLLSLELDAPTAVGSHGVASWKPLKAAY